MNGIVAENGKVVTDEMIADWESALERDEWPSGWVNVGEVVEGRLPKAAPETVTLSLKVPVAMKRALEKEAKAEGKSTGAYARGFLADSLLAIAYIGKKKAPASLAAAGSFPAAALAALAAGRGDATPSKPS